VTKSDFLPQDVPCEFCGTLFFKKFKRYKFCSKACNTKAQTLKLGKEKKKQINAKSRTRTLQTYLAYSLQSKPSRKGVLSVEDLVNIYNRQNGKCAITGLSMTYIVGKGRVPTNISIDRIEAGGSYNKENVRLVCSCVNSIRWTQTDKELFDICEVILRNNGYVVTRSIDSSGNTSIT